MLYLFHVIISTHGWSWFTDLAKQNVQWLRGSYTPAVLISDPANRAALSINAPPVAPNLTFVAPNDRFMAWAQTGAIFKSTQMPETAKLLMGFLMSESYQRSNAAAGVFGTRNDLGFPDPYVADKAVGPEGFAEWMADRENVEWLKLQFETILGTPQWKSPLEDGVGPS